MFVYNIGDIIWVGLIGLLIIVLIFKLIRYNYLKHKYKKCPKCGSGTYQVTEVNYMFGDMESYEKISCKNEKADRCDWHFKLKF